MLHFLVAFTLQEFRKFWNLEENRVANEYQYDLIVDDIVRLLIEGWGVTLTSGLELLHFT